MASSLPPRPKPWESGASGSAGPSTSVQPSAFDTAVASSSGASAPALPDRPPNLESSVGAYKPAGGYGMTQPYASRYGSGGYGTGGYGMMSGYGGLGGMGYNSYSSPYSRMGGGYGYNSYNSGYGYGVGGMGGPGEANNLSNSIQQSTAPAFAVVESLVTAFTSLAQLVESTYMATHSSFFAMVGVADQLGSLKSYLGQVLGVFSVLRIGRRLVAWLKGRGTNDTWVNEWAGSASHGKPGKKPSAKPLLLFLLSAFGLPYLMSRLIRLLIQHTQTQQIGVNPIEGNIDPSKLVFGRAKWEFNAKEDWELSLGRDEIVAVLEMRDQGKDAQGSGWWRGRTRDGKVGWFPGNYVEVIKRREQQQQ